MDKCFLFFCAAASDERSYIMGALALALAAISFASLCAFLAAWFQRDPENPTASRDAGDISALFSASPKSAKFGKMLLYFFIFAFSLSVYYAIFYLA